MRNRLSLIVLGWLLLSGLAGAAEDSSKSFLWRVEAGNGGRVHLLGSVHAVNDELYPLAPAIEDAYAACDVVIFEVDLGQMVEAASLMMKMGALPAGTTLDQVVSKETWTQVKRYLDEAGLPTSGFDQMRPWFLALNLTALELGKHGFRADQGIDMHLYGRASSDGKEIRGLESVAFQVELFAGLGAETSEDFLRYSLNEMDEVLPLMNQVVEAWEKGDAAALDEMLGSAFTEYPELYETIVSERNRSWLKTIEKQLESKRETLVVVGALHLVGHEGLVEQLRSAGFSVVQQ